MDVISSNAPYFINVGARDGDGNALGHYYVYKGDSSAGELIYSGLCYADETYHSVSIPINMQPILVNYTRESVGQIQNVGSSFSLGTTSYLGQGFYFEYKTHTGADASTNAFMLYCTENATNSELGFTSPGTTFPKVGNDFIQKKFVNGSYLSIAGLYGSSSTSTTTVALVGVTSSGSTSTVFSNSVQMQPKRYEGNYTFGSTYKYFYVTIGGVRKTPNIEIANCLPENSYILYYVNTLGAVDYIICDKKNSVTYNAERHSMTRYATIQDRTAFGKLNYLNNSTRTWTLNTDIMDDEQSKQMYKVFNSEYMWLYDCDKGQMNSVVLEDASLKIKRFDADKIYNYTITVKESQTFTIQ